VLERKEVSDDRDLLHKLNPLLERVPGVFAIGKVSQNAEGAAMVLANGNASGLAMGYGVRDHVSIAICEFAAAPNEPEF
jgi:hypothetical protein